MLSYQCLTTSWNELRLYCHACYFDVSRAAGSYALTSGCMVYRRSPWGVVTTIGLELLFLTIGLLGYLCQWIRSFERATREIQSFQGGVRWRGRRRSSSHLA